MENIPALLEEFLQPPSRNRSNTRLTLEMNGMQAIMALGEGNPGALRVCTEILLGGLAFDPDCLLGGQGHLLMLDSFGIYGPRIWMLFKDVCKEELGRTIAILRACQLGFVSREDLDHAIDNRGAGIDIIDLTRQVIDRLKTFDLAPCGL